MDDPRGSGRTGGRPGPGTVVRLYALGLLLLPPPVRIADGREMLLTFTDLWREKLGPRRRVALLFRSFRRLPWVALLEWKDHFTRGPVRASQKKPRRWGMSSWMKNMGYALRTLKKSPSFTFTTLLLIALGVGAVTTIFTLVDHVLLRPLPYPSADRLFLVENGSHSGPTAREFQEMSTVERWGMVLSETANLVGQGDPLRLRASEVSRDFFGLFGARPEVGRLLVEGDYLANDVVVLSHGLWERAFGSDPGVVGRSIRVNDTPLTVVGVLSPDFIPPEAVFHGRAGSDVWLPLDWSRPELEHPGYHNLQIAGLMAPGASLGDVGQEIDRALNRLAQRYPEQFLSEDGTLSYDTPPAALQEITTRRVRGGLHLLLGAVGLLLLVACMNVAHLFLARALGRTREMAVRRALGADTPSLIQQLLVESLALGLAGGALGCGLAYLGLRTFLALNPAAIPRSGQVSLDLPVLLFAAAVTLAMVLVFGLVPAIRSMGQDLTRDLKGSSRSATSGRSTARLRNGLVVAEVALSLVLISGAGLLLKSFVQVQSRDPGIRTAGVWTLPLSPSWITSPAEYVEAMDRVEASLASIPGVEDATYSLTLPFEFTGSGRCCWMNSSVTAQGTEHQGLRLLLQPVKSSYFSTLDIPFEGGGVWGESEGMLDPWPLVLSEALAVEIFGSAEAALGQPMELAGEEISGRVYGVASDTRHFGLDQDSPLFIYLPMQKLPFDVPMAHMAVRVSTDPGAGWARTLREAVWSAVPDMPVPTIRSMDEWVAISTAERRFDSVLFGAFGAVALLLAAAGLYGTLLYSVGQRRKELGIRLALGAGRSRVERTVVVRGLSMAVLGSVLGLAGAWAGGRFLESRLYNLAPTDPGTLFTAVLVLLIVAVLASWVPARRAGGTDPLETLNAE